MGLGAIPNNMNNTNNNSTHQSPPSGGMGGWFGGLRLAFRNLRRNGLYTWINIVGLAVSLTAVILITLWVQDELSYDKFHRNAANIYRINAKMGEGNCWQTSPAPMAIAAKAEIPEVENICRIGDYGKGFWEYGGKKFYTLSGAAVDSSFFNMFNFPVVLGNEKKPFTDDLSMVISETQAKVLFGDEDPIGKVLKGNDDMLFHVTAVMKDMPKNSSLRYDYLVPFAVQQRTYSGNGIWKLVDEDWGNYFYETYARLKPDADVSLVSDKLSSMVTRLRANGPYSSGKNNYEFVLQSISKLHLFRTDGQPEGMKTVRLFGIIAVLILLIACINYVNLVTARAVKRTREIAVKKIMGASKQQLMLQQMGETLLLFLIALALSTIFIYLLFPAYNNIAEKEMVFSLLNPSVLGVYGVMAVCVVLLAGLYPAIHLSSFKPLEAFRSGASGRSKQGYFRKALVVLQFVFSFGLIAATVVISSQLSYMRNKNLGYSKENVFVVRARGMASHFDAVKNELMKNPDIVGVSASNSYTMYPGSSRGGTSWDGNNPDHNPVFCCGWMQPDFLQLMGVQMASGEYPSAQDSTYLWLNEEAVRTMGIDNPVGKRFWLNRGDENYYTIKGIMKDYNFEALNQPIKPLILVPYSGSYSYFYIKTTTAGAKSSVALAEKFWKQYNTDYEFSYRFLDENFDRMYRADLRTEKLLYIFAVIAIFVSCLGLFGLVTFTAETKTKEIGIRKVLGASITGIINMLTKEFLILVGIAMVVALPLAYYLLEKMLQDYAYRINLSWWMFVLAALVTVVLTLLTVAGQALKAARANPVKSIKTE